MSADLSQSWLAQAGRTVNRDGLLVMGLLAIAAGGVTIALTFLVASAALLFVGRALTVLGGGAFSHESYVPQPGTESIHNNAESLVGVTFSTFRFKTLNLRSHALVFPSLSDPGRLRLSSQSGLRIELIRNFKWNLDIYENYDTRPPVSAPKNDLGITTSIGWTF